MNNSDLIVENLRVTNSATLKGNTLVEDRFTVNTDKVRIGEFNDGVYSQFKSDAAFNSAEHINRENNETISHDTETFNRNSLNRTQNSKMVTINSSSENFTLNSDCNKYNYLDATTNANLRLKGDTRRMVLNINNRMRKHKNNGTSLIRQSFAVNNSTDKVLFEGADMVFATTIKEGVKDYTVQDNKVFEQKVVLLDGVESLQSVRVQDAFREQLILASLKDKRKATKV